MTKRGSFHVEYDHVTIDDTVFGYPDVIERVERFYPLLEYESRWIDFNKFVKENTVAFWRALGQRGHGVHFPLRLELINIPAGKHIFALGPYSEIIVYRVFGFFQAEVAAVQEHNYMLVCEGR